MRITWVLALGGMLTLVGAQRVAACSLIQPAPHTVDATMQGIDQTPPALSALALDSVHRSDPPSGCGGGAGDSCEGLASMSIRVAASDDTSQSDQIGFLIAFVGGRPPSGLYLPLNPIRPGSDGLLWFHWSDLDPDAELDFSLDVVPVDLAGNFGTPGAVRIKDGGSGGCRIAGSSRRSLAGSVSLLALAVLALRARRRASR
jgi:hypothetical protein